MSILRFPRWSRLAARGQAGRALAALALSAALSVVVSIALPAPALAAGPPTAAAPAARPAAQPAGRSAPQPAAALEFNGAFYLHRWSKGNQHEFTPAGQEDLQRWQDMITFVDRPDARDEASLRALAQALLETYKKAGGIINSASTTPTPERPAEYLIVAMLRGEGVLETVFARIGLVQGSGVITLYARRHYGADPEAQQAQLGPWIKANAETVETQLMAFDQTPSAAQMQRLPQSR